MPVSPVQFRESVGKYHKNFSRIHKPIKSLAFTNSTTFTEITKIVGNYLTNTNVAMDFEDRRFLNISSGNQNAVKTSLLLLIFLSEIGVANSQSSIRTSSFKAPLLKRDDKNCNRNSSVECDPSDNPFIRIWENINNGLNSKLMMFDWFRFPAAEAISLSKFSHIEKTHTIRHHKRTYLNNRILKQTNKNLSNFLQKEKILERHNRKKVTKEKLIFLAFEYANLDPENLKKIARKIFSKLSPDLLEKDESLSIIHSQAVMSDWMFTTVLGNPLTQYIAKTVAEDPYHSNYTINNIIELLSVAKLEEEKIINFDGLSEEIESNFEILWNSYVEKELPFIHYCNEDTSLKAISLEDLEFSNLYTGARYLSEFNNFNNSESYTHLSNSSEYNVLNHFNASEVSTIGRVMWEIVSNEGISIATEPYFLMPSLFFEAQNAPQKIIQAKNINDITETAIIDQLTYRKIAEQINKSIMLNLYKFKNLLIEWNQMEDDLKNVNNEEYQKLIGQMKEYFSDIDEYLLVAGLNSVSHDEKQFIFSPDARVSPIIISKQRKNIGKILVPIRGIKCFNENLVHVRCSISLPQPVKINRTDLFSVYTKKEKRIYALKNNDNRYEIFRVDKNLYKYRQLGILDPQEIKNGHIISKDEIKIGTKVFHFKFDHDKNFTHETASFKKLIEFLKNKHSDVLYRFLYKAGNNPSTLEKIWDTLKHFLPLYDCIDNVLHNDIKEALPSCLLDAVVISPLFKGSISTVEKFGLYVAKGLRTTGLSLNKNSISFVSSHKAFLKEINFSAVNELRTIQKNIFSSVDTRFQSFSEANKQYTDRLINYLNKDENTVSLAEKIQSIASEKELSDFRDSYITGRLPNSEIRVPIRKVGEKEGRDIYTVFNPQTRETAWGRFILEENNQLLLLEASPLSISNSLEKIITEDMYAKDVEVHSLSEPDYMGLQWDYEHANCYLNHKNKWLKIKILKEQLFLDSKKGIIPLKIKNYTLLREGFLDRIVRLQREGFTGTNVTVKQVIAEKLNISEAEATQLIEKYQFPEHSTHYTRKTFALWIQKTGQIPPWAEAFEILNRENYISRFASGGIENNGLYSFSGGKGFVYRVDRTRPDIILHQGFTPTEDYGALEKMIPDEEPGLTVAGDLTGALRYNKWVNSPYIYKIDLENVRGVSLKENLIKNPHNLKSFLGENSEETYTTIESLGEDCNGAIYLDEIHLYNSDILPDYINLVTQEEIEKELPLAEGVWENYS